MNLLIDTNLLIDKVAGLLPILEARGAVYLFAFAEEKEVDRWDVVISSEWSDQDSAAAVRFVAGELRRYLQPEELTLISRIAVISSHDPKINGLTERFDHIVPQDNFAMPSWMLQDEFLGSGVRIAYVFKVQKVSVPRPKEPQGAAEALS